MLGEKRISGTVTMILMMTQIKIILFYMKYSNGHTKFYTVLKRKKQLSGHFYKIKIFLTK